MTGVTKAELHVHLEGTVEPALLARLAKRAGRSLPAGLVGNDGHYVFDDFLGFLRAYDAAAEVVRSPEAFAEITRAYLDACAAEGVVYAELIVSPTHARMAGVPDAALWEAVGGELAAARERHGLEAWALAAIVRDRGPAEAEALVADVLAAAPACVVGVNLVGDEEGQPADRFGRAFAAAAEGGLGCAVHAGEHAGPASVRAALALPGVTRISHGVRAIEDPALVAELAERGVVLEVCPTSNVVLGVVDTVADHPLRTLHDAGVRVTLGSDDPPWFGTTIGGEYALAREAFGFTEDQLRAVTRTAVAAGFAPAQAREPLLR